MKRRRRAVIRHAQQLGLPEDVMLGLPRMSLRGNSSLILENHQGVLEYGDAIVRLRTPLGILQIEGEGMTLAQMGKHDLLMRGVIHAIRFC